MDSTILDVIERRKTGRRVTDQSALAVWWPTLVGGALALLAIGYALGKMT